MNEHSLKREDHGTPNMEALRRYGAEVRGSAAVIEHPATPRITDAQVAKIITRRAGILIKISKKAKSTEFIIDEHNQSVLTALKWYVMRDQRFETEGYGELNKGIFIGGLQGCGKTMIMKSLADAGPLEWLHDASIIRSIADIREKSWGDGVQFGLYSLSNFYNCVQLEHDYRQPDGEKKISAIRNSRAAMVFDDLGFENDKVMNYGNRINIMAEIINSRYNTFQDFGIPTHFTSNMVDGDDIERTYSVRIRSRLREMCNVLYFNPENHIDRRK